MHLSITVGRAADEAMSSMTSKIVADACRVSLVLTNYVTEGVDVAANLGEAASEEARLGDEGAGRTKRKMRSAFMACARQTDVVEDKLGSSDSAPSRHVVEDEDARFPDKVAMLGEA